MIEVWTWPTPNGWKVHIALEELGLPYAVVPVNIGAGEQFRPEFLAITPNHRIPAIVDPDGPAGRLTLFESGAILLYLAEKTGRLMPAEPAARWAAVQWLMFQMGGVGPMFGQFNHFSQYAPEKLPYAVDRYTNEMRRLNGVLNTRLGEAGYLAGEEYSMADIATFPWVFAMEKRKLMDIAEFPALARWYAEILDRPAVRRGIDVLAEHRRQGAMTDAERDVLFGKTQFAKR